MSEKNNPVILDLIYAYILFTVVNFILIIIAIGLSCEGDDLKWFAAGVWLSFCVIIFAPINTLVLLLLYQIKFYRNILKKKRYVIIESASYYILQSILNLTHLTNGDLIDIFIPFAVIIVSLLLYAFTYTLIKKFR